jgi:type VI secretion system secreted protein VgrG
MAKEAFQIKSDSPVNADLMFWQIAGHESLSRPSIYQMVVLSLKGDIDGKDILGRAFDVQLEFVDAKNEKKERHFQGHGIRFLRTGILGRYYRYEITLQSWFGLLSKRSNSRILQDKPILEVLEAIFEDSPIKRFKKLKVDNVTGTHHPLRYCVQHQENDYQYISRLLEDEGIYYWFDSHDAAGTMHLSDSSEVAHEKLPVVDKLKFLTSGKTEARFNEVTRWVSVRQFDTGKHDSRDSNFKTIRQKIGVPIDVADDHELAEFESFEFPGGYFDNEAAQDSAKIRGNELIARRDRHFGTTPWPDVAPGRTFTLEGDQDGLYNGDYLIGSCTFFISHPGYEALPTDSFGTSALNTLSDFIKKDAFNESHVDSLISFVTESFTAKQMAQGARQFVISVLPGDMPFKPPRLTPKVVMPGPQSAIVVGPKGDELHVDDKGRVKVQFHWDRYGEKNEKSTCWVRVSQPWAGKGWGGYFIPRIGQEVIVDFLNGDPDRPIIVGRVYNDEQTIPYSSPTQSGFKSRSTPGGSAKNYNEIMFEDKKGSEALSMHAEKDMSSSIKNDHSTSVGHDQSISVKHNQSTSIQNNRELNVKGNDATDITGFQKLTVKKNQDNHIVGYQTTNVDIDHALIVKGNHKIAVTGERNDLTTANENRSVLGNQTITVTGNMAQKAAKMTFEAGHIDFKVTGGNSVLWDCNAAPYKSAFMSYELISNTKLDLIAMGDINQISLGSNTTVLGANSSGYIGNSSETNLGRSSSTFLGSATDNCIGISQSNFAGLNISNTLAMTLNSTVGPTIERCSAKPQDAGIFMFKPGLGTATASSGIVQGIAGAASVVSALRALVITGLGVYATAKQYSDAAKLIEKAMGDPNISKIPGLAARLARFKAMLDNRGTGLWAATGAVLTDGAILAAPSVGAVAGLAAGSISTSMAIGAGLEAGVAVGGAAGIAGGITDSVNNLGDSDVGKAETAMKNEAEKMQENLDSSTQKSADEITKNQIDAAAEKANKAEEGAKKAQEMTKAAEDRAKVAEDARKAADDAKKVAEEKADALAKELAEKNLPKPPSGKPGP